MTRKDFILLFLSYLENNNYCHDKSNDQVRCCRKALSNKKTGRSLFYILMIPNAFATELNKIIAAKIGQTYLIMKVKIFSRLNGLL